MKPDHSCLKSSEWGIQKNLMFPKQVFDILYQQTPKLMQSSFDFYFLNYGVRLKCPAAAAW